MARKIADSGTLNVDVNEWLEALHATGKRGDAGLSSVEIAAAWGVSVQTALQRLQQLHALGLLAVGKRDGLSLTGVRKTVPVYSVIRTEKAKKK